LSCPSWGPSCCWFCIAWSSGGRARLNTRVGPSLPAIHGGDSMAEIRNRPESDRSTMRERMGERVSGHTHKRTRRVLSASSLSGDRVRNTAGEDLGKIEDIMLDIPSGRIAYAVLS